SRRRHTRSDRDWSSDVCSSDLEKRYLRKDRSFVWVNVTASLVPIHGNPHYLIVAIEDITARKKAEADLKSAMECSYHQANHDTRSEERRVGKERRVRRRPAKQM